MKKWVALYLALSAVAAQANSFVGNGGNKGDVELAVTLMQIQETLKVLVSQSPESDGLCVCNKMYSRSPLCEPLKALNPAQVKYCGEGLLQQAPVILKLVGERGQVRVRWTDSPIEVMENGQTRAAEAVANRKTGEITVNQAAFRSMHPAERVFLLTHELMHFTDVQGQALTDKGALGPFAGEDGSRDYINAVAASASVLQGAYPKQIKSYRAKLQRSQAWKNLWLTADLGTSFMDRKPGTNYGFNNYFRAGLMARYQWSHFGVFLGYRNLQQDKKLLDTIQLKEDINIFSLGATYRIFFADDPLTFSGQMHLLVKAAAEYVRSDYKLSEEVPSAGYTLEDTAHASVLGAMVGVEYYIPLFWGLWTNLGVSYEYHPYVLKTFDLKYDRNNFSAYGGLSYAF